MYKTHTCGELRTSHIGQVVTLAGWVHRRRDHGGVIFFDLRDRYGLVQITMNPTLSRETLDVIAEVRFEWVLQITGKVTKRPSGMENPKMETGEIEVIATEVKVLNPAKTLPFMVSGEEQEADENTRLKYRYLDLRRPEMARNLRVRSKVATALPCSIPIRPARQARSPMSTFVPPISMPRPCLGWRRPAPRSRPSSRTFPPRH